jgi:hypothetical protein
VRVLESIRPENAGTGAETLVYEGLAAAVEKYQPTNQERWSRFLGSERDSLDELHDARQLASEYLLRTSEKTIQAAEANHDLWADRFTPDIHPSIRTLLGE